MDHLERQADLINLAEVQETALLSKKLKMLSSDNLSTDEVLQKRRKMDMELECEAEHNEGDDNSKEFVCQPDSPNDEIHSELGSINPKLPSESLQSWDYWASDANVDDERLITVPNFTLDPITLRKELAKMIILHEYPLSMVNHSGFKDFLCNLNPHFGLVSQKTVKRDIMKIYKFERCSVYNQLSAESGESKKPSGRVAITTKMWTSSDGNQKFLAISGHRVDDEWKKQSYIMRFVNVPLPCTNKSICKVILKCISEYDVGKNLSAFTVDNHTSDNELGNMLVDKLSQRSKLLFRDKLFQLPCFAHTMSLMVQDGFDVIKHVIEKIRYSIMFWTSSSEREMAFNKAASDLGVKTTAKLVVDDGSRWSSTYLMLKESFVFEDIFSYLGMLEAQYIFLPLKDEWELAREVCNRLEYLYEHMKALTYRPDESRPYICNITEIKMNLLQWLDCEIPEIKEMASKMIEKFDKYWLLARDILGIAYILQPEYQLNFPDVIFDKMGGKEAASEVEKIRQAFYDLFNDYKVSLHKEEPSDEELRLRLSPMSYKFSKYLKEKRKREGEKCEVQKYLEDDFDPGTGHFDVLSWWETHKYRYRVLHQMAIDILVIPIFAVDKENAFDMGDWILGLNRSKLHPALVEALICTQKWIRRPKVSKSEVLSSDTNIHSLGTIYDDANADHGIILKANSEDIGDKSGNETFELFE